MAYMLPHLGSGYAVDQAIVEEQERVVVIRFGHDYDRDCMIVDEVLFSIAEKVKNFAVIYLVDITAVPDFNQMYELYDPVSVYVHAVLILFLSRISFCCCCYRCFPIYVRMFFFRNKHIMVDLGTGNNNKINWAFDNKQEMIDIIELVYRAARKGRGLAVSSIDYSTRHRY